MSLAATLGEQLHFQYRDHPHWSYQLHYDNLAALVKADPSLGILPSYSTVKRFMQAHGWCADRSLGPAHALVRSWQKKAHDARGPQLRSHARRRLMASRFPPWIAQGAHCRRSVAAPACTGRSRRPLAIVLSPPVVPLGDSRGPGARSLPGDPEAGSAAFPHDRQRLGDGGRGSHRRTLAAGHCPRAARCRTAPIKRAILHLAPLSSSQRKPVGNRS